MHVQIRFRVHALFVCLVAALPLSSQAQGSFTIQIGADPPVALVAHTNSWRFHKGTNAPVVGWQTNAEATLDNTWAAGPGGFGYADNSTEATNVRTALPDMLNRYTTFYVRRSFEITNAIDPAQQLSLAIDWDDGFI